MAEMPRQDDVCREPETGKVKEYEDEDVKIRNSRIRSVAGRDGRSVAHGQSQSSCVTGGAVSAGNAGLSQDCEALLDSLDTLPGSSTSLNWSDSRSISQWTGVSLGGSPQRVTSIKLMRQNLDGSIPADIGRVEKLVDLWLYHNSLQGPIPADLGNLAELRTLMLGWNNLSGQIPDTLNNLTLNRLWLRNNDFTAACHITSRWCPTTTWMTCPCPSAAPAHSPRPLPWEKLQRR